MTKTAKHPAAGEIVCVIDALDECESKERERLLNLISDYYLDFDGSTSGSRLKILITSRQYSGIALEFKLLSKCSTYVHFHGDEKSEMISQEINRVIDIK